MELINCTHLPDERRRRSCALRDNLPQSLQVLNCSRCDILTHLPNNLPPSLQKLNCSECPALTHLPGKLPQSLRVLNCSECPKLTQLPDNLPQSLRVLNCHSCPMLTHLPDNLPQSLQSLHCSQCPVLTYLPGNLPQSLQTLFCYNCPNLYLPYDLHMRYRPKEKMVPHPMYPIIMAEAKLNLHLPVLQRRFLERLYHPDSRFVKEVLTKRFYENAFNQTM